MEVDSDKLKSLDSRLKTLEGVVYSHDPRTAGDGQVITKLLLVANKLKEFEKGNSGARKLFEDLESLEQLASMCHADVLEMPTESKINYIEASENQIRSQIRQLESIEKLRWVLDSEHLKSKVSTDLTARLLKLSQIQLKVEDEAEESLARTKELVDNYNNAISSLSQQFETWNAMVARLEERNPTLVD